MARCPAQREYVPRTTQECDALVIVREHLPKFLERLETETGTTLPAFVRAELEAFTTCGDFEQGFLLLACGHCGEQLRVPFACKNRGVCPSCMGRRMCETAALLVDERLPAVPYRQWVLSFPGPLAVRLGYDTELLGQVCKSLSNRVMQALRRQVKQEHDLATSRTLHPGVLVVVQRFRSDLGLFVHLHCLVTDGCFEELAEGPPRFLPATALSEDHLIRVLEVVHRDLASKLDEAPPEPDGGIGACVSLSNRRQLHLVPADEPVVPKPMTVAGYGMQLHAATCVDGRDRRRLERLCRYLLRPPFAQDAVKARPDGQVRIYYKQPTRHGSTFTDISRDTFLARLAALVPPPHFNLVRYYGVFANRHKLRPHITPDADREQQPRQLTLFELRAGHEVASIGARDHTTSPGPGRIRWATLLARVFKVDVSTCPRCQGPMRMLDAVTDPDKIALHLHGARAPPRPSPPEQLSLLAG